MKMKSNKPVPSKTSDSEQPGTLISLEKLTLVPGSTMYSALPTAKMKTHKHTNTQTIQFKGIVLKINEIGWVNTWSFRSEKGKKTLVSKIGEMVMWRWDWWELVEELGVKNIAWSFRDAFGNVWGWWCCWRRRCNHAHHFLLRAPADNKFSCTTQIEEDLLVFFFLIYLLFLDLYVCLYIIP